MTRRVRIAVLLATLALAAVAIPVGADILEAREGARRASVKLHVWR